MTYQQATEQGAAPDRLRPSAVGELGRWAACARRFSSRGFPNDRIKVWLAFGKKNLTPSNTLIT